MRSFQLPPEVLHASLIQRFMKCGKANCHCHTDPEAKHGPFYYLNRCFAKGKMQSLLLKPAAQVDEARQSVAAYAQVQAQLGQISPIQPRIAPSRRPPRRRRLMNELALFLTYVVKVFALNRLVRGVRDARPQPVIPTRPLLLSLLLGVVLRVGSYHHLAKQTKRRRFQHLIHWPQRISEDAFYYVSERFYLEDLRQPW